MILGETPLPPRPSSSTGTRRRRPHPRRPTDRGCGFSAAALRAGADASRARPGTLRIMRTRIVILGGGTGGTIWPTACAARLDADEADDHGRRPRRRARLPAGPPVRPLRARRRRRLVRPRHRQLHRDMRFRAGGGRPRRDGGEHRPPRRRRRARLRRPVVAAGARLVPEETEGLTGPGWFERAFPFYTLEGATRAAARAAPLRRRPARRQPRRHADQVPGRAARVHVPRRLVPRERGIRERTELVYVTPLDGAFTKPAASKLLPTLLETKRVEVVTEFNAGEVDGDAGVLRSYDEREVTFDLLVTVPLHSGAAFVDRSPGLGDDTGFVPHRPAHAAVARDPERVRDRRRDQPADVEGRLGHALRGRDARPRTSRASSPTSRSRARSTATRTASSRPASTRRS